MNKLSSMFQTAGRTESPGTAEEKAPTARESVAVPAEQAPAPAADSREASHSTMDEKMTFSRAKGLLSQAASSAANGFLGLLKNQATPADVLRNTLEEVIEYRAAEAALTRVADETALRAICAEPAAAPKTLVRLS
jgi:hypothetical protein